MSRLGEIRERTERATRGPWEIWEDAVAPTTPLTGKLVVRRQNRPAGHLIIAAGATDPKDAEFIAHAREDVPALLAVAEAAERLLAGPRGGDQWTGRFQALGAALAPLLKDGNEGRKRDEDAYSESVRAFRKGLGIR